MYISPRCISPPDVYLPPRCISPPEIWPRGDHPSTTYRNHTRGKFAREIREGNAREIPGKKGGARGGGQAQRRGRAPTRPIDHLVCSTVESPAREISEKRGGGSIVGGGGQRAGSRRHRRCCSRTWPRAPQTRWSCCGRSPCPQTPAGTCPSCRPPAGSRGAALPRDARGRAGEASRRRPAEPRRGNLHGKTREGRGATELVGDPGVVFEPVDELALRDAPVPVLVQLRAPETVTRRPAPSGSRSSRMGPRDQQREAALKGVARARAPRGRSP